MASSVVGALRVNLGLDSAKFSRGMTDAQKRLKVARAQFTAVAGAAAAFGAALTAAAIKGAQEIDRVAKAARRLDTSIAGFRAMELAAGEAGVSMSSLTNDVQTMNREIANIGKTGNAQRALDALGLAASDLAGKDADEQLATLADRITDMGLSAGETTAILRDLGVRNREMVLALMGGGDVFRNARKDVEDYGLALDDVDASKIETANDQMARLGLVTQYVGQQLAVALVPALGRMAEAFTDSLREGGLLRTLIDGLADNIDTLVYSVGVAVAAFGTKLVFALVAAKGAVGALIASLVALRGALIATGIGAVVVLAGYLIAKLLDLVEKTGGWAEALSLLGEVASGVWEGIVTAAGAIPKGLEAVWKTVEAGFFSMLSRIAGAWGAFLGEMSATASKFKIPGTEDWGLNLLSKGSGSAIEAAARYDAQSAGAARRAAAAGEAAGTVAVEGFDKAREALAKLNTTTKEHAVDTDRMKAALLKAKLELNGGGGDGSGGGGGSGGGVAGAVDNLNEKLTESGPIMVSYASSFKNAFGGLIDGLVDGSKNGIKALEDLGKSLVAMALKTQLFKGLAAMMPGVFGASGSMPLIGSNATGTSHWRGGLTSVNERGGEIMNLPRGTQIIPHDISKRMADGRGGGGTVVNIINNTSEKVSQKRERGPDGREYVTAIVGEEMGRGSFDGALQARNGVGVRKVRR